MRLACDPILIEEVVFLALRRAGERDAEARRFRQRSEQAYRLRDPEERDAAFAALNTEFFERLGLDDAVRKLLAEHAEALARVQTFLLQAVFSNKEEGAELYGQHGIFTVALRIRPETLADRALTERLCRHEFLHLADMLDPVFAYDPHTRFPGQTQAQQNLARDRFCALWDLRIDARLIAAGHLGAQPREVHASRFQKLFGAGAGADDVFAGLFDGDGLLHATHAGLLAAATTPGRLATFAGMDVPWRAEPSASPPCLACGFPSRVWAAHPERIPEAALRDLRLRLPHWTPEQGLCRHCEEMLQCSASAGGWVEAQERP